MNKFILLIALLHVLKAYDLESILYYFYIPVDKLFYAEDGISYIRLYRVDNIHEARHKSQDTYSAAIKFTAFNASDQKKRDITAYSEVTIFFT
jgi:hypothetical protein